METARTKCSGAEVELAACDLDACGGPPPCEWGAWSDWGACPVTCGGAWRLRHRALHPGPGAPCVGNDADAEPCGAPPLFKLPLRVRHEMVDEISVAAVFYFPDDPPSLRGNEEAGVPRAALTVRSQARERYRLLRRRRRARALRL